MINTTSRYSDSSLISLGFCQRAADSLILPWLGAESCKLLQAQKAGQTLFPFNEKESLWKEEDVPHLGR